MTNFSDGQSPTKRIAAIDLGTNSFHAVLVDIYPDGSFRTIDKLKEMVILAEKGMDKYLSESAMNRGLEALKRIKSLCDSHQVEVILAFATSAIREAKNGGDFIQRIQSEAGIKARAISGQMEAEMIGYAVRHSISMSEENVLMADVGGGSVEFIIGNKNEFLYMESYKLGVARMSARFVNSDPIIDKEINDLKQHYKATLENLIEKVKQYEVKTIIGSSGTMENIGAMVANRNSISSSISLNELIFHDQEFQQFYKNFILLDREQRKEEKALEEKRIDIINPGMVLLKFLIDELGIQDIKISEAALRDGMILNYIDKEKETLPLIANFPDPRKRSVFELLRKCNWMEDHSMHVAKLGLQIFDELKQELQLEDEDRELLDFSCLLHDIGYYISYRKHHKHALYLIRNSDLKGFSEDEINIMANVTRYHRKSLPAKRHFRYKKLSKDLRNRVKKLAAILRVADGLDRSHYQNVVSLKVVNSEDKIQLFIKTKGDPELEIWGAERKTELLEKVTGKKLEIIHSEKSE